MSWLENWASFRVKWAVFCFTHSPDDSPRHDSNRTKQPLASEQTENLFFLFYSIELSWGQELKNWHPGQIGKCKFSGVAFRWVSSESVCVGADGGFICLFTVRKWHFAPPKSRSPPLQASAMLNVVFYSHWLNFCFTSQQIVSPTAHPHKIFPSFSEIPLEARKHPHLWNRFFLSSKPSANGGVIRGWCCIWGKPEWVGN